jgi:CheY-like chemotaxis protein
LNQCYYFYRNGGAEMNKQKVCQLVNKRLLMEIGHRVVAGEPMYDQDKHQWHVPLLCYPDLRRQESGQPVVVGTAVLDNSSFVEFPTREQVSQALRVEKKKRARILLAEDVDAIREGWKKSFDRRKPYGNIEFAENGKEAVFKVEQQPFHVAVLDVNMPEMSGIEALREIKRIQEDISAFFLTGTLSREEVAKRAKQIHVPPERLPQGPAYLVALKGEQALTAGELEQLIDCLLLERYEDLPREMIVPANGNSHGTPSAPERTEISQAMSPTEIQRLGWDTFCRELPHLLQEHPGKWVAFHGKKRVVLGASKQEVYVQLKQIRCPLEEVVVRRIESLGPPVDLRRLRKARSQ